MSDNHEVLMPLMGEGITEATLVKWLKKPGEQVKKEEPLLEVSTDKVDTEIPAPASGFLAAVLADEGQTVAVNSVIAHIAAQPGASAQAAKDVVDQQPGGLVQPKAGATAASALPPHSAPATKTAPPPTTAAANELGSQKRGGAEAPTGKGLRSSPLVRKMARATNIDLAHVRGTGLAGRITKRDLETFVKGGGQPAATPAGAPVARGPAHMEYGRLETKRDAAGKEILDGVPVRREKMTKMRALIAEHMVRSVRTSPHVTTIFEIDMHKVVTLRERHKTSFQQREGMNLTYTHFFIHAAIQAIKRHPVVNCSVDGEDILWKDQINLGCAVAIDSGLIVPVIKNAGELNLTGVAKRLSDLTTRARTKKLTPDDVQGGTFSVTNPGMFGSIVSAPIINQPQVAILSIGAIVKRPVVIDDPGSPRGDAASGGVIAIRPLVQIGLTFDHRVVDGEGGARYLATLKELLESYDESAL